MHPLTTLPVAFVSDAVLPALHSPDLDWHVHSVFRQALNLEAGGRLVAVAPQAAGGLPNGVSIAGRADFQALRVAEGMAVVGRWPRFDLPAAGLSLELGRAWSWSPRLRSGTIDPLDAGIRRRTALAADIVAARATMVGFGECVALLHVKTARTAVAASTITLTPREMPSWASAAAIGLRSIETLRDALAAHDLPTALSAADALVGLGDGLTPSGDDLLVGLTAALRAVGHPAAAPLATHAAARAVGRTTDVARVALEHAARGEYAERLHDVLEAVARGDDSAVGLQIGRALAWGASSGADTMLGVLIGLEAMAQA